MRTDPVSRRPWLWLTVAFCWWTLNGFASASHYHFVSAASERPVSWSHALLATMSSAWLWVPLTLFAFWLAGRFPLERGHIPLSVAVHFAAAAGIVLLRAGFVVALNPWIGWYAEMPPFGAVLLTSVVNNVFLYWMLVGVAHAIHYGARYREGERQLVQAELNALKAQLQPHFLFNSLNTVSALVYEDPAAADRMIARLSELLRRTLAASGRQEVPLSEELDFVGAYLEIEKARFEDRLRVEWEIDPATLDARVPHLLLQPLVENSIRHGLSPRGAPGTVTIRSERADGVLRLEVRDDGVGLRSGGSVEAAEEVAAGGEDPEPALSQGVVFGNEYSAPPRRPGTGLGLATTRARLAQLYGERHQFELADASPTGVAVTITLPFRTAHR